MEQNERETRAIAVFIEKRKQVAGIFCLDGNPNDLLAFSPVLAQNWTLQIQTFYFSLSMDLTRQDCTLRREVSSPLTLS